MERQVFCRRMLEATECAVACARELVSNRLPERVRYLVHLNQSYDGNELEDGERVFPEDRIRFVDPIGPIDMESTTGILWRDGLIPEWIDIAVVDADSETTYVELLCCGRFTACDRHLYHRKAGVPPFSPKSPAVPMDWNKGDPTFDLHWRKRTSGDEK